LSYANMNLAQYWQYDGGLTTPPCSEVVDWHVLMEKRTLTQAQLDVIKVTTGTFGAGGNFRVPQPWGSRVVMGCTAFTTTWGWPENADWNTVQYSVCASGTQQSPIDLAVCAEIEASSNPIAPVNWGMALELVHSHGMKVNMPNTGIAFQTNMRGAMYTLAQCHLHWGSEHTFDTEQDALCMHCVHTKDGVTSGRTHGVLGFTWNVGEVTDDFLTPWIASSPGHGEVAVTIANPSNGINMALAYENLNLAHFWQYDGGLTTPPCSEIVDWHVLMGKRSLTQIQLDSIKDTIHVTGGNFRAPKPLGSRTVEGCVGGQGGDDGEFEDSGASRVYWRGALSILAFLSIC